MLKNRNSNNFHVTVDVTNILSMKIGNAIY